MALGALIPVESLCDTPGLGQLVWLAATEPAPPGGLFWHDRAPRPTHFLGLHRESAADVDRVWRSCLDAVGLD